MIRRLALLVGLMASPAFAQEAAPVGEDVPPPDKVKKKPKAPTADWPIDGLTVGGRVFARETFASVDAGPWTGVMSLESVRINLEYEQKRVRAVVKTELASGEAKLRDAFVQVRATPQLSVRVGRFKLPSSAIEDASRWTLPTIDRGFLSDVYDDGLALAGRRVGALVIGKLATSLAPKLEVGAFQTLTIDGDPQPGTWAQRFGLLGIVRGSIKPRPELELDAWGSTRLQHDGAHPIPHREWATGVDAVLDLDDRCGPRAWVEASVGSSAFDATPASTGRVHYATTRAIVSHRIGERVTRHGWFVEPYVAGALIDPDLGVADDAVWEASLGANVGQWRRWRVQLQGDLRRAGDDRPTGLAGEADLRDREAFTLQLGSAF